MDDWDPLMSALDDAMYEVAYQWEKQKQQNGKQQILASMNGWDYSNMHSPTVKTNLESYFEDQPDNHRHQCNNECCATVCSAW